MGFILIGKDENGAEPLSQSRPDKPEGFAKRHYNSSPVAFVKRSTNRSAGDCRVLCRQVARVNDIEQAGELSYAIGATASGRDDSAL